MKNNTLINFLSGVALSAFAVGCGGQAAVEQTADTNQAVQSRIHIMPVQRESTPPPGERAASAAQTLTYYGGPVLKNVQVYPIYWRSTPNCASTSQGAYTCHVGSSMYTSLLPQYSGIGTGTNHAAYLDTGASSSTSLSESTIISRLNALFTAGVIPQPGANNYYPIHFPAGVSITASDGSRSCVQFCAYHGTYVRNGVNVYFGVIPDLGGSCAGGCGASTQCNNTASVQSHELVEATTDPAVGLATTFGPPLAWYNATYGEIGDICNGSQSSVTCSNGTFTIQREWSNSKSACAVN
ncbi:MAG TPA: hypothetical protein VH877_00705 [Polyangia bacterium]|nr:hypothetical protein [Polyangia bacterium]